MTDSSIFDESCISFNHNWFLGAVFNKTVGDAEVTLTTSVQLNAGEEPIALIQNAWPEQTMLLLPFVEKVRLFVASSLIIEFA